MTKRYDVMAPRKGKEDKTFWHRVGTAFEGAKGIGIEFDSLPLPDKEGRVSVRLFEPRDKQAPTQDRVPTPQTKAERHAEMDDEIPF
jgi:hypothetical protein